MQFQAMLEFQVCFRVVEVPYYAVGAPEARRALKNQEVIILYRSMCPRW